jgi:hypothetical protein
MKGLLLIASLLLAAACGTEPDTGSSRAFDPMPASGVVDPWIKVGEAILFTGMNLYGHINGGAEVFLELGFDRLLVQRYSNGSEEVTVEAYRMADEVAALGIYLMKCGKEAPDRSLAERHTAGRYQVQFVRGSTYGVLNNPSGAESAGTALPLLAAALADALPQGQSAGLFDPLPQKERIPGSERVIRGPFTLQAVYPLGSGDLLQLGGQVTALAADYGISPALAHTQIVAAYPDDSRARSAFNHAAKNLDSSIEILSQDESTVLFRDWAGKFGKLEIHDRRLHLTANRTEGWGAGEME